MILFAYFYIIKLFDMLLHSIRLAYIISEFREIRLILIFQFKLCWYKFPLKSSFLFSYTLNILTTYRFAFVCDTDVHFAIRSGGI